MVLQRADKEVLLNSGLDTKQSDAFQDVGTATQVDNLHYNQMGELVKRPGYASEATLETLADLTEYAATDIECLFPYNDTAMGLTANYGVVRVDPNDATNLLYTHRTYSTQQTSDEITQYAPKACKVSRRILASSQQGPAQGIVNATSAIYGTALVTAWLEDGQIVFKAVDAVTGKQLGATQYYNLSDEKAIQAIPYNVSGSEGVLITVLSGSSAPYTINCFLWNASTYDVSFETALSTNAKYTYVALAQHNVSEGFYLAFTDNTSGFVVARYYTNISTILTTYTSTKEGPRGLAIVKGNDYALLAIATASTVFAEVYDDAASTETLFTAGVSEAFWGVALCYHEDTVATVYANTYTTGAPYYTRIASNTVAFPLGVITVGSTESTVPQAWLAGAPFVYDDRVYCPMALNTDGLTALSSVILARYTEQTSSGQTRVYHDPVARLLHNRYYFVSYASIGSPPPVANIYGDKAFLSLTADLSTTGTFPQTLFHSIVEFTDSAMPLPHTQVGQQAFVSSGLLLDYDGEIPSYATPLCRPGQPYIDAASGTGTTWVNVAMLAVYYWIDDAGNLHRSAPSAVTQSSTVTNKQVDVYVPLHPFDRDDTTNLRISAQLYLTEDEGTTYYLCEVTPTEVANYWKFADVEAGLTYNTQLYSTGTGGTERLANPPPAFRDIALVQDRLIGIDAEDPTRIWYTKPFLTGYAPEWSSLQTLTIGAEGMAVRDLGGIIAVLAKDSCWAIDGIGPDSLGNGSFSLPRKTGSVGCIDTTAVVSTPMGIFYRSMRGIQLLDQSFTSQFIGLPIEHETRLDNLTGYVPGRAIWDELSQEVRFLDNTNTCQWLYHVGEGKWSKYTGTVPVDLVNIEGRTWALTSGNVIAREYSPEETSTSSNGWVYRTPWLTLNGLVGFGRVWELVLQLRVRTNVTNSTITVGYETRGPDTATETFTYTGAQLATLGSDIIEVRLSPTMQKCKSFRLTITETCSATYAGTSPLALRLIYGAEKAVKTTKTNALKGST